MISFRLEGIKNIFVRDNFQKLEEFLKSFELLKGTWAFFEIPEESSAFSNKRIRHGFRFTPKHAILLHASSDAKVTFNHDQFDDRFFVVSSDVPCRIECFVGSRYQES